MTNEKIKKLQLEIAKTTEAQKKSEQKYKEKIKGLRDELKKEEERLKRENDSLIGDIVRDLLGEVDAEYVVELMKELKIGKISSSHKGICVHTPSGKKIFIDENGKTKVIWDN